MVVGDLVGSGAAQEQAVVGETPNLAARLQGLAEPGSVVIADGTRRLVGGLFEHVDLGGVEAKGFAEPVRAYRVVGVGTAASRFEAFHAAGLTPLVGREEEIGPAAAALAPGPERRGPGGPALRRAGDRQVAAAGGAAGAARRGAAHPPALFLLAAPPGQPPAPVRGPARARGRASRAATRRRRRLEKLEALLASTSPPAEDVALLAELLSLPTGGRHAAAALAPQRKRERTFEALLRPVERLARRGPVLMVFEDVHWIDPSSRELLDLVIERAARLPVLLLVTFRPEFQPSWTGQPHVTALVLNRLGRREGDALVRRVAGGAALPDDLVAEIVARADGVPLSSRS